MPTKRSQEMLGLIRSHKKIANEISNHWLMKMDAPAETVAKLRMNGTTARAIKDCGIPAIMISPRQVVKEDAVILHLHGGAYVSGGILQCRAIASPICAAAKIRTMTFTYRLAPKYPYPAQLEDAMQAYDYLRKQGYAPENIALVGESAGGNLTLALALRLRKMGEPLPAAIALLSPWVDLAQTGASYQTLRNQDATLDADDLMESAVDFAGSWQRLKDPEISPVYADFTGFPPVLIHCGTSEILLSDAEMLEEAMLRCHVNAHLVRWAGMCHVFQAFGFEESRAANQQIGVFLRSHLTGED